MKNKIRGPMQLIKVALYMITNKSGEGKPSSAAARWKKIFGLVQPLHLESREQLSTSLPPPVPCIEVPQRDPEGDRALVSPLASPAVMTPYASVENLLDLDNPEENDQEEEKDNYYDGIEGDEMIDTKAEEFIARFYQQMMLQDETGTTS